MAETALYGAGPCSEQGGVSKGSALTRTETEFAQMQRGNRLTPVVRRSFSTWQKKGTAMRAGYHVFAFQRRAVFTTRHVSRIGEWNEIAQETETSATFPRITTYSAIGMY